MTRTVTERIACQNLRQKRQCLRISFFFGVCVWRGGLKPESIPLRYRAEKR